MVSGLEAQMKQAARNLEFERAAALRDEILQLRRLREELAAAPGTIPADVYAAAAAAERSIDERAPSPPAAGRLHHGRHAEHHSRPGPSAGPHVADDRDRAGGRPMAGTMPHAIFVETGLDGGVDGGRLRGGAARLRDVRRRATTRR